jgi:hypothetical protein
MSPSAPAFVPITTRQPHDRTTRRHHHSTTPPLAYTDVYVDDFCVLAQGSAARLNRVRRTLFHSIDDVLRPNDASDDPSRLEPISVKKLTKGDGCWSTVATLLGWQFDTIRRTLELPPHRHDRLLEILTSVRNRRRVAVRTWQCFLGELRSMAIALPGGRGLFSHLQEAFRHVTHGRVRLDTHAQAAIDDFWTIANSVMARPTHFSELVYARTPLSPLGACDASGKGMGGIWLPPATQPRSHLATQPPPPHPPTLWRALFSSAIQRQLISDHNRHGSVTNSDLELAGALAHQDVLTDLMDCSDLTISTLSDNASAVHWHRRGSVTTAGPAAYLLRLFALHQRHHDRYHARLSHIPGIHNMMADDCSRLWHLNDSQLLSYFNCIYPQALPWQMHQLSPSTNSALTSALLRQSPAPTWLSDDPSPPPTPGPTLLAPFLRHLGHRRPVLTTRP